MKRTVQDDYLDKVNGDEQVNDLISENNRLAAYYKDKAKKWTQANKKLMDMPVTELTTRKEIRDAYRNK